MREANQVHFVTTKHIANSLPYDAQGIPKSNRYVLILSIPYVMFKLSTQD